MSDEDQDKSLMVITGHNDGNAKSNVDKFNPNDFSTALRGHILTCNAMFDRRDEPVAAAYSNKSKNEITRLILTQAYINYLDHAKADCLIEDDSYVEGPYDERYKTNIVDFFEGGTKASGEEFASRVNYSSRVHFILADLIQRGYLYYAHPIWNRKGKAAFICRLTPIGVSLACSSSALAREFPLPKKNSCFVIMSFADDKRLMDYYRFGIKSAVETLGYECVRADKIEHNGRITEKVLDELDNSRFVIADLTQARPNCYYELGYAHHARKDVVPTIHSSSTIHFDVKDYNFIIYESASELQDRLTKRIEGTIGKIDSVVG
jgi:hypothetical protein